MAVNWNLVVGIAARVFGVLVKSLTPEIRKLVTDAVKSWEEKAAATDNPWDDHFVDVLKTILEIK
jgi:hypothetical protein